MEWMGEEKLHFLLLKSVKRKKAQFRAKYLTRFVANCRFKLYQIAFGPARKSYGKGALVRHKDDEFGTISITERTALVEPHLLDRFR